MIPTELLKTVRRIEIRSRRIVESTLAGEYHSVFKGQGLNFAEVREYAFGDDIRLIDWNVTARAGTAHIKLFNEERELTVLIAVDLSASGHFGSRHQTKRELAAEVAAVIGLSALTNNDRIGSLLFTDRVESYISPKKGRSHVLRMVRDVLAFSPAHPGTSLNAMLNYVLRVQKRTAIVFVISDFLDQGYERTLKLAARQHDVVPIVIRDPHEHTLPQAGLIRFTDPETGVTRFIDTSDPRVRRAYDRQRDAEDVALNRLFQSVGIQPISIEVGHSYIEPLIRYFRTRGHR